MTDVESVIGKEAIEGLFKPTAEAIGLPGSVYSDPAFFRLERERWFAKDWVACAFESDVPAPGSAFPVSFAGWDLLLTRDEAGQIHAFHNLCAHRGMKVLGAACRAVNRLSCPWHSWTYDLRGRLVATPNLGGLHIGDAEGFDRSRLGLREVRCAAWLNLLFVSLDPRAGSFEEFIAPLRSRLADYDMNALALGEGRSEHVFHSNWKLVIEGGIEDYHLPWVHPQEWVKDNLFRSEYDAADRYVGFSSRYRVEADASSLRNPDGSGRLPSFPHLADRLPGDGYGWECGMYVVPPSAVYWVLYNMVVPTLLIPESHDQTRQRRTYLFIGEAATSPALADTRRAVRESWSSVAMQDTPIANTLQRMHGQRSELGLATRFSPYWEGAVHHFQKMVVRRLVG
jgi:choline monooxygenase